MTWIDRLERRARRLAVPNLMFFISGGMLLVYLLSLLFPHLTGLLSLDRAALFRGQVWRLLTFLFVPPTTSPLWILFQLYFNCLLGRGLEQQWGVFRFNLYYLCGMAGAILAALLTGVLAPRGASARRLAGAMAAGCLGCYALGTVWFMAITGISLWQSLALCVLPFLPGDAAKIALAAALGRKLAPRCGL